MASASPGVGLLAFGVLLMVFGGVTWEACASQVAPNGTTPDCTGPAVALFLGVLFLIVGGVWLAVMYSRNTTRIPTYSDPSVPPPIIHPVVIQQTIEREVVKVKCQYCGNLYPVTSRTCPSCGAPVG